VLAKYTELRIVIAKRSINVVALRFDIFTSSCPSGPLF
jgi:hypothetical protein